MKWEKVAIKDICTGIYDGPHATPPLSDTGAIFLGISNFNNGRLDFSDIRYISEDDLPKWTKRVIPQKNDIVFSYEATLNLYAIIPEGFHGCLGRRMALLRVDETKADYKFLYYYFYSDAWRATVNENIVLGATVDRIPLIKFPDFPVELPPLETQHRIADILSAYDDLIENNQKQIKLLEEAAQRLYKEWFVDLRFPGHENTKIVDGVPEGWRISSIYDVFDIKYGKNLPTSKITKAGQYPVYGASGVIGYYNEKNCDDYATLVTSRGNGSGDVFRTHHKQSYVTNNSFIARRNDKNSFIENEFTFQLFSNTDFKKLCTGSAQPQLTNTSIQKIKILLPNRQLIEKYQRCTIEMSEKQEALYQEQRALTQARNRLLPRLMNGTVEV